MFTIRLQSLWPLLGLLLAWPAAAGCPDQAAIDAYVADFVVARASAGFGKEVDAVCARSALMQALPKVAGERVGYKALFTNPDAQRRFGVNGPSWGAMFAHWMRPSGVEVAVSSGAKLRYEADFLVVVKDAGLADARTPSEAMQHITALVPFIEVPDLMLEGKPTAAELIATNAAFRGGVLGDRIAVTDSNASALLEALGRMEVVVTEDGAGQEVGRAKGEVLMGHPIHAAIWLAQALKQEGIALKPGDLLSLGGFLAAAPVQAGTKMRVQYLGLPGDPAVRVGFH